MSVSFSHLDTAKEKLLCGEYELAASFYDRARAEGVSETVIALRYLTKNYLVYPIEYETASVYFELIKDLKLLAEREPEYLPEYKRALLSLLDIKRLFLRSLSLFYFSDIAVTSEDSTVVREVGEIQRYIKVNKDEFPSELYAIKKHLPGADLDAFMRDLSIIEAFCMNILLTYTAVQHSVYSGRKYSATTIDYGYFFSTEVRASDKYYNYADLKPRLFLLGVGYEAYYDDLLALYREKLAELDGFDSPKVLRRALTDLIYYKDRSDESARDFIRYAKLFEKNDPARDSYVRMMFRINPLMRPFRRFYNAILGMDAIGSFELDEYFPRKKLCGVCEMIAAGNGWSVETVRLIAIFLGGCFIGVFIYAALALGMKAGKYFGVNVKKH